MKDQEPTTVIEGEPINRLSNCLDGHGRPQTVAIYESDYSIPTNPTEKTMKDRTNLPSREQMRDFLRRAYKRSRFEGRDADPLWKFDGQKYSSGIVESHLESLAAHGESFVSRHESATGEAIIFDASLTAMPVLDD